MNLKTIMALALAAAFAAPVLAQTPGRTTTDPKDSNPAAPAASSARGATSGFGAADRNNDGYISRDEAKDATWNSRFSELDKDNDGRLSQSEFNVLDAGAGASTTGGMGGSVGPGGTQSGSSTSGVGDKPGQRQ